MAIKNNASSLRDRLISSKVRNVGGLSIFIVDKSETSSLYDEIEGGDYALPAQFLVVLRDGSDSLARLGDGLNDWSTSLIVGGDGGGGASVDWDSLPGKPAVVAAGLDAASARGAIGAGTSSIIVGDSATDAAAGNHNHAVVADPASGLAAAANIQALAVALSARIKDLEDA